jgi:hypothetical protein
MAANTESEARAGQATSVTQRLTRESTNRSSPSTSATLRDRRNWVRFVHNAVYAIGLSQRKSGKRAQSPSVEQSVSPCSMANAAFLPICPFNENQKRLLCVFCVTRTCERDGAMETFLDGCARQKRGGNYATTSRRSQLHWHRHF